MKEQDLPGRVQANKDNDLLFRSTKTPEELEREREKQRKNGIPMHEAGPNDSSGLEYFTE